MRLAGLSIAALVNPAVLRELVALPESDFLERKRCADATTLAKTVSGFANTNGGWLLLGVDDDGTLVGWQPKGSAHPRDWLRDVLDNHLDPLPHFAADVFELDGHPIGVVRVPRSAAAPHFMNATGELFQRRNGQTRRAPSERVRELTLRSDGEARQLARRRLDQPEAALDVAIALDAHGQRERDDAAALASIVRISLFEASETLRTWVYEPTSLATTDAFVKSAASSLDSLGPRWPSQPRVSHARPMARGHSARALWGGRILKEIVVAWDNGGLGGVRLAGTRIDDSGVLFLFSSDVRDAWLMAPLEYLLGSLEQAGAFGLATVRWDLHGVQGADVMTLGEGKIVASRGRIPDHHGNTIGLEIDIEVGAIIPADLAAALWQQLERLAESVET